MTAPELLEPCEPSLAQATASALTADGEVKTVEIPRNFICPLSRKIMANPLMTRRGLNFERSAITEWLAGGTGKCPVTGSPLGARDLLPNRALTTQIDHWRKKNDILLVQDDKNNGGDDDNDDSFVGFLNVSGSNGLSQSQSALSEWDNREGPLSNEKCTRTAGMVSCRSQPSLASIASSGTPSSAPTNKSSSSHSPQRKAKNRICSGGGSAHERLLQVSPNKSNNKSGGGGGGGGSSHSRCGGNSSSHSRCGGNSSSHSRRGRSPTRSPTKKKGSAAAGGASPTRLSPARLSPTKKGTPAGSSPTRLSPTKKGGGNLATCRSQLSLLTPTTRGSSMTPSRSQPSLRRGKSPNRGVSGGKNATFDPVSTIQAAPKQINLLMSKVLKTATRELDNGTDATPAS